MNIPAMDAEMDALRPAWRRPVVLGVIMVALGIFAIASPYITGVALSLLLGIVLIIGAILHVVSVFRMRDTSRIVLSLLLALVYLAAGVVLVSYPLGGLVALTLFLASFFLVEGVLKIVGALEVRPYAHWGWNLFSGIVSVLLAVLIWTGWPASVTWAVGLLVGVDLIVTGWAMVAFGLMLHGLLGGLTHRTVGQH
jgi:uncharacterized membrane protein HdeD (DUF308 family)